MAISARLATRVVIFYLSVKNDDAFQLGLYFTHKGVIEFEKAMWQEAPFCYWYFAPLLVPDMGSYASQGNQIVVYSMMGLNRTVTYSLQGNTLTFVDRSSGYPLTTVYYRMK